MRAKIWQFQTTNRWLSKFEARRRQTDESIAVLADDLRQMSQKAYSNLDPRAQEALALNQLYKSISLEMKCRCIDKNCKTVADAVEVIERYEAILGKVIQRRSRPLEQSAKDSLVDTMVIGEVTSNFLPRDQPWCKQYGKCTPADAATAGENREQYEQERPLQFPLWRKVTRE